MSAHTIDICMCTFRRPHVETTLRSLAGLVLRPEWSVRVIVADNDDTPTAQELVTQTAASLGLNLTYLHAPARNISVARNACLEAATAEFIAFLDDDEIATPEWLHVLVSTLTSSQADVVLGPVRAVYPEYAPAWATQGNFHATMPVWVKNNIVTGYTCNVILRRSAIGALRFRPELGKSGGEDTAFFSTLHQQGRRIAFAPEAWLHETVTPERLSLCWLFKRRFRSGQTHGFLLEEAHPARLAHLLRAAAKLAVCAFMTLAMLWHPTRFRFWLLRGAVHLGVISRLLGKQELTQYG